MTVAEYLKNKAYLDNSGYFEGLGNGVSWASTWFDVYHNKKMYCPPDKMAMYGNNYVDFLNREIEHRKINEPKAYMKLHIEYLLIESLIKTFPCK